MAHERALLVIADPIARWDQKREGTLALAAEAQSSGWRVFHSTPQDVVFSGEGLRAAATSVSVEWPARLGAEAFRVTQGATTYVPLESLGAVLVRPDPPVDLAYLHMLQLLTTVEERVRIVNRPSRLLRWNEKLSALLFADAMLPTVIRMEGSTVLDAKERNTRKNWGETVTKSLDEARGRGVSRSGSTGASGSAPPKPVWLLEQPFNPRVAEGDKRVFIVAGKVVGGFNRIPADGAWLASIRLGAKITPLNLTPAEVSICQRIGEWSKREDLHFLGVDLIGERLSEINLTSVGGLVEAQENYGVEVAKEFFRSLAMA